MGDLNILAAVIGAVVFFAIGALWYGPLFGKTWKAAIGWEGDKLPYPVSKHPMWLIMGLAFLFELLVTVMLAHLIARTSPPPFVVMMMAFGFGATIMTPALGINYLFQQRHGKLFAIDAGYMIVGMTAVGAVFVALG